MTAHNMLIQIIGLIATILVAITYIKNSRFTMLWLQFSASIMFAAHYWLLGAVTGALLSLLVAVRCLVYWKWDKNKILIVAFMVAFGASGIVTWQNNYSILPVLGSALFSLAFWVQSPKNIRLLSIIPSLLWGIYGILTGSWGGIATEILCLSSIAAGYFKHDFRNAEASRAAVS